VIYKFEPAVKNAVDLRENPEVKDGVERGVEKGVENKYNN
jgi:hypothetical protein